MGSEACGPKLKRASLILGELASGPPAGLTRRNFKRCGGFKEARGLLPAKKEIWMKRPILICAFYALTAVALGAQQPSQSDPYEGTSNPPPDDTIVTTVPVQPKPAAGKRASDQSTMPEQGARMNNAQPGSIDPAMNYPDAAMYTPDQTASGNHTPGLSQRTYVADPDGDIVHPRITVRPGELVGGTTIRVKLLNELSTSFSEKGESFRTRVASDVLQGGKVLIPAGSEIDGKVVEISRGHFAGHGTMRLRPETVILPDGRRYRLDAEVTGTPGSNTNVGGEGTIRPGSRLKTNGIEYGAGVGGGAVTGAFLGGPVGALTGSLVGAGLVSVHLLMSHPQATLKQGTYLQFALTEPLYLRETNSTSSSNSNDGNN
jgi:hypothetical protein